MRPERTITNVFEDTFEPYDLDGPVQDNMQQIRISWDRESGKGCYIIRMEPGTQTIPHTHRFMEDYYIIEGELIESDGTVLKKGDVISYLPGTHHNSRTETGCLLLGVDWSTD